MSSALNLPAFIGHDECTVDNCGFAYNVGADGKCPARLVAARIKPNQAAAADHHDDAAGASEWTSGDRVAHRPLPDNA